MERLAILPSLFNNFFNVTQQSYFSCKSSTLTKIYIIKFKKSSNSSLLISFIHLKINFGIFLPNLVAEPISYFN